jgi:hypothetical protein
MSNLLGFIILLAMLRGHQAWASPKFSSPPESPMDGFPTFQLTYVPAYLRSGLPTFRLTYTSSAAHIFFILTAIIAAIAIVHPLFKRNIYLSLLCDWIFLCLQNHFSFSFLPSMQLKHVILIPTADIVHFSSHVQASHVVMHLFLCC